MQMSETTYAVAVLEHAPVGPAKCEHEARACLQAARDFEIDCPEMRVLADKDLSAVKRLRKSVEEFRKEKTAPLDAAKKGWMDHFRAATGFLDDAEAIWTPKILQYDREEAKKRAEAQRLANEAAEAQRKALEEQARTLEAAAPETAVALKEAAQMVSAPVIPLAVPKSEQSTNHRVTWSADVTSVDDLILAIAMGSVSKEAFIPNMKYLDGLARLEHEKMNIPGVRAVPTESLSQKRA
jgi:FtsZ-binding cell division protein ZapB